ncbi:MAG: flagellar hook-length control protein FliK, partial [Nitrospiraceae bacterium]
MTPTSQQAVTTSVQQTRLPLPDFNARVDTPDESLQQSGFGRVLEQAKAGANRGRERADGAIAAHHQHNSGSKEAQDAHRASRSGRRADASHEASKPERSRRDEPIEARRQDERDEDAPAEKENSSPDAQTVSLAAANAQPKQEQQSAPVDAPDDKAGPSESANEAMPTEASVTPLANGQQVLTAQALKAQGNAQAPGQDAASATALPQQGEGAEATKENVAAVSPSMEKQSEEKDGESSLLSKVTDLLMQADRKIQELKDAMSSSPASSNQDVELSFAEFRAETAHWTSGDSSSGETSRQFDMTSQAEQSKTTGAAGPPSGPQASFGHTMVEAGTNGTAASSATGNGEPRSLSAPQATSTVRQPEDASPLPQTFKSVTVDLDPLDMGPLRVRVMMAEQTVHTHIRTEHGVLGQGLVQQGHQLESSLRTTGLEMGFLRVTVDQQQQGRGDAGTGYQRPGQ